MILVPGLAYDADGYRIGYGEGYYHSFMIQHPNTIKIGVFYLFQQVAWVPRELHKARFEQLDISNSIV